MLQEAKVDARTILRVSELNFFCLDSTVLAYVMKTLNERYNYGLELFLLSIDEGITGYRDDSLEVGNPIPRAVPGFTVR